MLWEVDVEISARDAHCQRFPGVAQVDLGKLQTTLHENDRDNFRVESAPNADDDWHANLVFRAGLPKDIIRYIAQAVAMCAKILPEADVMGPKAYRQEATRHACRVFLPERVARRARPSRATSDYAALTITPPSSGRRSSSRRFPASPRALQRRKVGR